MSGSPCKFCGAFSGHGFTPDFEVCPLKTDAELRADAKLHARERRQMRDYYERRHKALETRLALANGSRAILKAENNALRKHAKKKGELYGRIAELETYLKLAMNELHKYDPVNAEQFLKIL